jgi:hypothetical protein
LVEAALAMEKVIKDDQKKEAKQGLSIEVKNKDFVFFTSSPPLPKKRKGSQLTN